MGSLRIRPTRRAGLRSGTTASSGMRHIASSCTSYACVFSKTWVPMQSGRAPPGSCMISWQNSGNDLYKKRLHAGQRRACVWPNHLVGRPSLQSGNETNALLKSGPALAGPAGPATPPLYYNTSGVYMHVSFLCFASYYIPDFGCCRPKFIFHAVSSVVL